MNPYLLKAVCSFLLAHETFSQSDLAAQTGRSKPQVRRAIARMERIGAVQRVSYNGYRVISHEPIKGLLSKLAANETAEARRAQRGNPGGAKSPEARRKMTEPLMQFAAGVKSFTVSAAARALDARNRNAVRLTMERLVDCGRLYRNTRANLKHDQIRYSTKPFPTEPKFQKPAPAAPAHISRKEAEYLAWRSQLEIKSPGAIVGFTEREAA